MSAKRLTDEQVAEIQNTMWSRWESMHHLGGNELGDLMRAEMLDAGHAWAQVEALKAENERLRSVVVEAHELFGRVFEEGASYAVDAFLHEHKDVVKGGAA